MTSQNKNYGERAAELADAIMDNDPTTTEQAIELVKVYSQLAHAQALRQLAAALRATSAVVGTIPPAQAENVSSERTEPEKIVSIPKVTPFDEIMHDPQAEALISAARDAQEQLLAIYGDTPQMRSALATIMTDPDEATNFA